MGHEFLYWPEVRNPGGGAAMKGGAEAATLDSGESGGENGSGSPRRSKVASIGRSTASGRPHDDPLEEVALLGKRKKVE